MSKTLEKYIIQIASINYHIQKNLKHYQQALMVYSQMVFQQILWNSDKGPRLQMDFLQMYFIITGWLPGE